MVALFAAAVLGAWHPRPFAAWLMVVTAATGALGLRWGLRRPGARVLVLVAVCVAVSSLAHAQQRAVQQVPMGAWTGVATLRTDPDRRGYAVRAVLEVDGYRYEAWARGIAARSLERRLAGEQVVVVGRRHPVEGVRRGFLLTRHVVGRLEVEHVAGAGAGSAATRAANRVHRVIAEVGARWSNDHAALLSGLVLGNDAALSDSAVAAFRRSGLSHLTAVSGQNVALLLAVLAPFIASLGRTLRWVLTVAVVAWFVVLTRFEPSVLRASAMAVLGASAAVLGRDRRPLRLLALAGVALLAIDPFLVRSVSFWLSISATTGLVLAAPGLARVIDAWAPNTGGRARRWAGAAFTTTAAAQVGVLAVSTVVFGLPSSVSLLTNVAAVPAAGAVMTCGPALAALGAAWPDAAQLVATPVQGLVRWIHMVAHLGQRLAPPAQVDVAVWTAVVGVMLRGAWRRRRGR